MEDITRVTINIREGDAAIKDIPHAAGIYIFSLDNKPIYIGQTKDLYRRIHTHLRNISKEEYNFKPYKSKAKEKYRQMWIAGARITISYQEEDIKSLNALEKALIDKYRPYYNIEGVDKPYYGVKQKEKIMNKQIGGDYDNRLYK